MDARPRMPEIDISDDQRAALEALQADLAEAHVGAYGTVRPRDALQFLLDYHAAGGDLDAGVPAGLGAAAPPGGDDGTDADDEPEAAGGADDEEADEEGASGAGDEDERLEEMLNLLETHDDKWSVSDSDEGGKYVVALPDGKSMHVRTKDEVRALLFRHYR